MSADAISVSTPLSEAFAGSGSHARVVLDGSKPVGLLTMRGMLETWQTKGSFDGLTAADIMHPEVISMVKSNNTLRAARLFAEHKVKSIAVIDDGGNFVSMINPQDLIPELTSTLLAFFQPASQVMIRNPYTIAPDATIREAIDMLVSTRVSCLVVSSAGEATGMLSESDLLRAVTGNRDLNGKVSEIMAAPIITMTENSNLRQVWEMMDDEKIMKMVMTDYADHVSGLITATDVLVTICKGMLGTFSAYHCPDGTDIMAEWRKSGLIMAVSDEITSHFGTTAEELIGMHWQDGCNKICMDNLLEMPKDGTAEINWKFGDKALTFTASRDVEHAAMWWKLKA